MTVFMQSDWDNSSERLRNDAAGAGGTAVTATSSSSSVGVVCVVLRTMSMVWRFKLKHLCERISTRRRKTHAIVIAIVMVTVQAVERGARHHATHFRCAELSNGMGWRLMVMVARACVGCLARPCVDDAL